MGTQLTGVFKNVEGISNNPGRNGQFATWLRELRSARAVIITQCVKSFNKTIF